MPGMEARVLYEWQRLNKISNIGGGLAGGCTVMDIGLFAVSSFIRESLVTKSVELRQ